MLPTSFAASPTTTIPKLASDGSNWIVWKTRTQILIGAKKLARLLDEATVRPTAPTPLTDKSSATETAAYETALEKCLEFDQSDMEAKHIIVSTIPDSLLIETAKCTTASSLWKAICVEHENKTKFFVVEMLRFLQNQRCSETDDVKQHLAKLLKLREELATSGKVIDDTDFTSIITNSLPPSYDNVISSAYAAAIAIKIEITTDQIISIVREEHTRRQISNGNSHPTSTALFSNPQRTSSKRNNWKKREDVCTNQRCRFRFNHEFKDCWSEGGPRHGQMPPQVRSQPNGNGGRRGPEGRNAQQIMRANVAHEEEEPFEHAFNVTTSFSIADIVPGPTDPSERVEIYDSGASCHMSPYIEAFTDFTFIEPKPISAADNRTFEAVGKGSIQVKIPNDDGFTTVILRDVLYAPTIGFTLVSLSRADKAGYSTLIRDGDLHILDRKEDDNVIGKIPARNGLWSVRRTIKALENGRGLLPGNHAFKALENGASLLPGDQALKALENGVDLLPGSQTLEALENGVSLLPGARALATISLMDLHRCLGHISPAAAIQLIDKRILTGVTVSDRDIGFCEVCALTKIKRHPFPKSRAHPAQNVGDVIHTDLWGPASVTALGGGVYMILFIDEYSRYGVVAFLRTKDESFREYRNFESWLRVQFQRSVKCLQSDRGGEFTGNEFNEHLREQGTIRHLTVHDSPQSNGIAERCNGVLIEHARAMLVDSGLPRFLWKEAVRFSMWVRNRTTTHHLDGRTPYEVLYGAKPEIGGIHLWGSRVWVRSLTAGKLDPRGREGRFVGYDAESKGCCVYWTDSRTVGVERDLIFEDRPMDNELICLPESSIVKDRPKIARTAQSPSDESTPPATEASTVDNTVSPSDIPLPPPDENELADPDESVVTNSESITPVTSNEGVHDVNPHIRRSTRVRKPSSRVQRILETTRGKLPKGV